LLSVASRYSGSGHRGTRSRRDRSFQCLRRRSVKQAIAEMASVRVRKDRSRRIPTLRDRARTEIVGFTFCANAQGPKSSDSPSARTRKNRSRGIHSFRDRTRTQVVAFTLCANAQGPKSSNSLFARTRKSQNRRIHALRERARPPPYEIGQTRVRQARARSPQRGR